MRRSEFPASLDAMSHQHADMSEHGHSHDGEHGHGHDGGHGHDHRPAALARLRHLLRPHSHEAADKVDAAMEASAEGMRVLWISLAILGVTAASKPSWSPCPAPSRCWATRSTTPRTR